MALADRGEVWVVDLGYVAKTRPCLVLSVPALVTDRALATVIPYTSKGRGTRFEVEMTTSFVAGGVFGAQNPVTTPHAKFLKRLGVLTPDQMDLVEIAVRQWLGL